MIERQKVIARIVETSQDYFASFTPVVNYTTSFAQLLAEFGAMEAKRDQPKGGERHSDTYCIRTMPFTLWHLHVEACLSFSLIDVLVFSCSRALLSQERQSSSFLSCFRSSRLFCSPW